MAANDDLSEREHSATGDPGIDPAAMSLALGASTQNDRVAARAEAFLEKQSQLADLQIKRMKAQDDHIEEEQRLQLSHLRVRRFSDYAKGAMEITIALAVLILICGLGALVVQARGAKGLVAEPIKTPPDYAMRGLDGTVLAQELLDKLNRIAARASHSDLRAPDKIVGSWSNQTNVQIPTTGISLAELTRLLNNWLGHQTHISGEVVRMASGIALTVRVENNTGATFIGPESGLDELLERAATSLFRQTQPFEYVVSLTGAITDPDIIPIARQLAEFGPRDQRAYGYLTWGSVLQNRGDFRGALIQYNQAVKFAPDDPYPYFSRWPIELALGHLEAGLADANATVRLLNAAPSWIRPDAAAATVPQVASDRAVFTGAFLEAAKLAEVAGNYDLFDYNTLAPLQIANYYAKAHDSQKAREILAANPQLKDIDSLGLYIFGDMVLPSVAVHTVNGEWTAAARTLSTVDRQAQQYTEYVSIRHTFLWPWLAYAWARMGNVKGGEELIAMTPHDCTLCLEMRGRIADVADDTRGAAYWFDRAVKDAPSVPFAMTDWGEMLRHHGDYDGAISKFEQAHEKGPHFADPLEMWGEALMQENRSDLALARFEEANKYAPRWGRLHLKWGEALFYLGHKDQARAQYQAAATMDLSAADKIILARHLRTAA